jgi:YbgC/YbaW family acyl-CoA thioester hydrolase
MNLIPIFRVAPRSYELDALGHVNHAVYLNWFEQARYDALAEAGLPPEALLARGWGVHVVRIEVDYRKEVRLGGRFVVLTWTEAVRNSSMTIRQALRDEVTGAVYAEARVVAVWIGEDGRPMRIPDDVRSAFDGWEAPDEG